MSVAAAPAALMAFVVGVAVAAVLVPFFVRNAPTALVRVNVSGERVPAVLGAPLVIAAMAAIAGLAAAHSLGWDLPGTGRAPAATALVIGVMGGAGRYDDLRGDEPSRGFRGHLGARRLTGGLIKLLAGGLSGLAAGVIVWGDASDPAAVLETGALVALTANLVNLFDRSPGRAAKAWLLLALPLLVFGSAAWSVAAAGLLGASAACLLPDLREHAMLGDAGANPLGAAAGLGLALSLERSGRLGALAVVLLLNLASERISFSRVIDGTAPLRALDRLGRSARGK